MAPPPREEGAAGCSALDLRLGGDAFPERVRLVRVRAVLGLERGRVGSPPRAARLRCVLDGLDILCGCGLRLRRHALPEGVLQIARAVRLVEGLAAVVCGKVRVALLGSTGAGSPGQVLRLGSRQLGYALAER